MKSTSDFKCVKCNFTTKHRHVYDRHMARKISCVESEKEKIFLCSLCSTPFLTENIMLMHERTCADTLKCPICWEVFKSRTTRHRHIHKNQCTEAMRPVQEEEDSDSDTEVHTFKPPVKKAGQCVHCEKWATYNYSGKKRAYCASCRLPGMVDVQRKTCTECEATASHVLESSEGQKTYFCMKHKPVDSVPSKNRLVKTCAHKDCDKTPTYGLYSYTCALVCKDHVFPGMVEKRKICDLCDKSPVYGLPGCSASRCTEHNIAGYVRQPNKRCAEMTCSDLATHGYLPDDRRVCEFHAGKDMVNIVNRICKNCSIPSVVNHEDLCEYCTPSSSYRPLDKQRNVENFLREQLPEWFQEKYDVRIDRMVSSGCIKERPDFYFDFGHIIIVIEVDEHKHAQRPRICELSRMFDIGQACGGVPVFFIRFNPDAYMCTKKQVDLNVRMSELVKEMQDIRDNWTPEVADDDFSLSVSWCKYMYYDHDDRTIVRVEPELLDLSQ